jgi:uncharacterized membrane protein
VNSLWIEIESVGKMAYIFSLEQGGSMRPVFLILLAALTLVACNSYKSKLQPQKDGNVIPASIDYAFVNAKVFQPYCIRCHSLAGGNKGDVNLETYENIIANLADIENEALVEKSMPPARAGGPLGAYEQNVLKLWIDSGAPKDAVSEPGPTPEPSPTVAPPTPTPIPAPTPVVDPVSVEPTWNSIYTNIFEPKCIKCHQAGKEGRDYPLADRAYVTDEENLFLKIGNPARSNLYIAITRQDRGIMPPPKTGMPLSDQEREAIRIWILNGAKD